MIPINQTPGVGNCLQASVASVLGMSLDEVPDFVNRPEGENKKWFPDLVEWAQRAGRGVCRFNIAGSWDDLPSLHNVWTVVVGKAPRPGPGRDHAVVCLANTEGDDVSFKFVHDPSETGVYINDLKYCFFFV